MNIKHTIAAIPLAVAGLALPLASFAAASDWMGPYIGAHLGSAQDEGVNMDISGGGSSESFDMTGTMGGLQSGYNWAAGAVVVGIEGTASAADISGDGNCPNPAFRCGANMDQLYTIKGRVGFPLNNFLLYATLGGAAANIEAEVKGIQHFTESDYQTGWLTGIGGAMAFTNHWNGSLELQYLDFGSNDYTLGGTRVSIDNQFYTLNFGVNYKF